MLKDVSSPCLAFFRVTLFCVMILEKLPVSGTEKLAFALIPIILNRICFLLKVNE